MVNSPRRISYYCSRTRPPNSRNCDQQWRPSSKWTHTGRGGFRVGEGSSPDGVSRDRGRGLADKTQRQGKEKENQTINSPQLQSGHYNDRCGCTGSTPSQGNRPTMPSKERSRFRDRPVPNQRTINAWRRAASTRCTSSASTYKHGLGDDGRCRNREQTRCQQAGRRDQTGRGDE